MKKPPSASVSPPIHTTQRVPRVSSKPRSGCGNGGEAAVEASALFAAASGSTRAGATEAGSGANGGGWGAAGEGAGGGCSGFCDRVSGGGPGPSGGPPGHVSLQSNPARG